MIHQRSQPKKPPMPAKTGAQNASPLSGAGAKLVSTPKAAPKIKPAKIPRIKFGYFGYFG